MKKLLLYLVLPIAFVAGVWGVSMAVKNHYESDKVQPIPVIAQVVSDQKVANVQAAADADHKAMVEKFNAQVTECEKGKAAYGKLTAAVRAQTPAPVCGQALVQ